MPASASRCAASSQSTVFGTSDRTPLCGAPRNARQVGYGLREGLAGEDIPAFRVVNGKGDLTGANSFPQPDMQPALLAAEGVIAHWNGHCWHVDLKTYGWPTTPADLEAFRLAFESSETSNRP